MKILYIAGHLSTGGMPEVLRARIESLSMMGIGAWVVEYSTYSTHYTTQRDAIIELVGERFLSLGWFSDDDVIAYNKYIQLRNLIETERFDIIHFDDTVETYDTFNKIHPLLLEFIYSPNRSWKIVETVHNSQFDGNVHKLWFPDAFMHCSEYNRNVTFSKFSNTIPTTVIEYPIVNRTNEWYERPDGFDARKINVVNIGIWTYGKNQKEAVEIARNLDVLYPDQYIFHFIGALAPNFKEYWEPILENLPKNVAIWDSQHQMGRFYKWADLIIFNSINELNPIVLKESISYRKPLLMRNLSIYDGQYDNYASYLTGDILADSLQIHSMLTNSNCIEYNFSKITKMGEDMIKFYEGIKDVFQYQPIPNTVTRHVNFLNGAFVELLGNDMSDTYTVQFIDRDTGEIRYSTKLLPNHWSKTITRYYVNWKIILTSDKSPNDTVEYNLDLNEKIVEIRFDSGAIGDTLAWIPYVDEFRKKHNCIVYCSTFHNHLFKNQYPDINFIQPTDDVQHPYVMYKLGWFYDEHGNADKSYHPNQFVNQPLQKTASDILGLDYKEVVPLITRYPYNGDLPKRYFTFSVQSTAQSKYWNHSIGWYNLLSMLGREGIVGVCVDKYGSFGNADYMNYRPNNSVDKTGLSLEDTMGVMSGAEFHIGISSGLSWLAWALGKKVVMISGFTEPELEFTHNCIRIHNDSVCNGCFSNPNYTFDKSDWEWCPVHKGTDRQFECTKSITPTMVFEKIKQEGLI